MNIPVTASKIIDRAILLEEGGAIVIPCPSYKEMERLRIRLYKLKKQLEGNYKEVGLALDITRKVGTDKWTLFITKDTSLSGVFVIEGGEAKPFIEEAEGERKEKEEVEEKEEDFDEVAAEIEATQGLVEEDKVQDLKEEENNFLRP